MDWYLLPHVAVVWIRVVVAARLQIFCPLLLLGAASAAPRPSESLSTRNGGCGTRGRGGETVQTEPLAGQIGDVRL